MPQTETGSTATDHNSGWLVNVPGGTTRAQERPQASHKALRPNGAVPKRQDVAAFGLRNRQAIRPPGYQWRGLHPLQPYSRAPHEIPPREG
jgi:hypothetical protein